MIYRHVGPRRDHIQLDAAEQRVLAELERSLCATERSKGRWVKRCARGRDRASALLAPLARLAHWLLPIGTLLMVAAISVSVVLSFVGSLMAAAGLAATLERTASRLRLSRERRPSGGQT
jgi:hypothetical protein